MPPLSQTDLDAIRERHEMDHKSAAAFFLAQHACDIHNDRAALLAELDRRQVPTKWQIETAALAVFGISPNKAEEVAEKVLALFQEPPPMTKFQRGDRVRKIKGYKFEGRVNGTFDYFDRPDGTPPMVNVQHDDGWVMHFRENELELVDPRP